MAETVTIEIEAIDKASSKLSNLATVITGINSAVQIGQQVFGAMQKVYTQTVAVAQEYDQQVRDMMLSTGATAEETSKLIQVIDDAGVSYGTLKTALKIASREGIEPNIESLAALSDQYIKLSAGVERNQFLMKNFGRGGLEMARAMELGGQKLRAMSEAMDGGLVLTQDNIDASEEYRKNLDELSDSVNALKISIGNDLIPELNNVYEGYLVLSDVLDETNNKMQSGEQTYKRAALYQSAVEQSLRQTREAAISAADAHNAHADALAGDTKAAEKNVTATEEDTAAIEEQQKALEKLNSQQLNTTQSMQTNEENYQQKYKEISNDLNLTDQERQQQYSDLAAQHDLDTKKIILNLLEQRLTEGGLTDDELTFLLDKGKAWGIYSDTVVKEAKKAQQEVQRMVDKVNSIPISKTFTLFMLSQNQITGVPDKKGRANGGTVAAGTPYIVGERGQELFVPSQNGTIIPNGKFGGAGNGGGAVVVNFTYAPALGTGDPAQIEQLSPIITNIVRRAYIGGQLGG